MILLMILLLFHRFFPTKCHPFVLPSPQSNAWYRWPARLVQYFASWGSLHRRKGAASHIIGYGLAISLAYRSEEEGGRLPFQIETNCLRGVYRKGRGESSLYFTPIPPFTSVISLKNTPSEKLCFNWYHKVCYTFHKVFNKRGGKWLSGHGDNNWRFKK